MPIRGRGTLVLCVPNLEINSANELLLILVKQQIHQNVVVLSPCKGPLAHHFFATGCSVRVGILHVLLRQVNQVFLVICSTMMMADLTAKSCQQYPTILILHNYWTSNYSVAETKKASVNTVKTALSKVGLVIFQSMAQMRSFHAVLPSETPRTVIYMGSLGPGSLLRYDSTKCLKSYVHTRMDSTVDMPPQQYNPQNPHKHLTEEATDFIQDTSSLQKIFIILSIGEVTPGENQIWLIQQFKQLRQTLRQTLAIGKAGIHLKLIIVRVSPETSTDWASGESAEYFPDVKALARDDQDIGRCTRTCTVLCAVYCVLYSNTNAASPSEVHEYSENINLLFHLADCVLLANTQKIVVCMSYMSGVPCASCMPHVLTLSVPLHSPSWRSNLWRDQSHCFSLTSSPQKI
jgi:glycosyltransferase involved in cell wall biosynthesis